MQRGSDMVSRDSDLESVLATPELHRRAPRPPDYETETRGLASLAQAMTQPPAAILRALAAAALSACRAGSAGVSLIEEGGLTSRWHAVEGELAPFLRGTMPRAFSPCGTVVDRGELQLFSFPQRHFVYLAKVQPTIVEALLIPFTVDGSAAGAIWVVSHDERRRFDAEDARLLDKLGKFAAAVYQLRSSADQAQQVCRRKDDFLALLAHEMQTPLFAMQLATELISRKPGDLDQVTAGTGVLRRQTGQLQRLVGDLLDGARIRRGKLELRQVRSELSPIVQAAAEASAPLIAARRHSLSFTPPAAPVAVMADPARIIQLVCNLLNNAAKFTPPGGHIRMSLEAESGEAVLRVADDGIGIAEEALAGIFAPYAQIQSPDILDRSGVGIGLGLARSLAELHGGTLEARSAGLAKGSEFTVRLPLAGIPAQSAVAYAAPSAPRPAAAALRIPAATALRILVVDDHRDTADALAWLLRRSLGHEAIAVYDGPSALKAAEEHAPDVILQDLGLPGMDGYEIARRLRRNSVAKEALLVAITAHPKPEAARLAEDAGFDRFLVKPLGLAALKEVLVSAASRRGRAAAKSADCGAAD
jgi:signal transduction histidine kinase/AmiR/NasT family two-component response regulator